MSRKFKVYKNPYDDVEIFKKSFVTVKEGLTILVGCNGYGKTTFLETVKESLRKNQIPYFSYDNHHEGTNSNMYGSALFEEDYSFLATAMGSSEGEKITMNISKFIKNVREFIDTGRTPKDKFADMFRMGEKEKPVNSNERWILLDAIDSGYSIDNVLGLKQIFELIEEDAQKMGRELYILVSANAYEMANGENCLDAVNNKYMKFKDYEDYKKFVLKSKNEKDQRYDD